MKYDGNYCWTINNSFDFSSFEVILPHSNDQVIFVFNSFIFFLFSTETLTLQALSPAFRFVWFLELMWNFSDRIINSVVQIWELVVPKKQWVIQNLRILVLWMVKQRARRGILTTRVRGVIPRTPHPWQHLSLNLLPQVRLVFQPVLLA